MFSKPYSIFEQMLEGVQVIDKSYRYLFVNDTLVMQSKKSKDELLGKTMEECYPGIEKTPVYGCIQKCFAESKSQELINEFDFPDGSKGFFKLRIIPLVDAVLIMSFDVTDQKRAEAIIESTKEYLEQLVSARTDELLEQKLIIEKQLSDLKVLNKTKDKFFSIVAHDLVGPLHSLLGFTNVLATSSTNFKPEEVERLAVNLQESVKSTLALAENLITWSREQMNTSRKSVIEKVKLNDMIGEVYGIYKELAERKGIALVYEAERELIAAADRNQLSFVIRNLVNNAIKFTKPRGLISIKTGLQNDSRLCISVSDNGTGIEDNVLDNIRNLCVDRSAIGTIGEKGTGLGLLLCYEFVSQNNGHIDIESNLGQGTTFNVFLDRYQTA